MKKSLKSALQSTLSFAIFAYCIVTACRAILAGPVEFSHPALGLVMMASFHYLVGFLRGLEKPESIHNDTYIWFYIYAVVTTVLYYTSRGMGLSESDLAAVDPGVVLGIGVLGYFVGIDMGKKHAMRSESQSL